MPLRRDLWLLLPRPVRRLPADLAAVVVLLLLSNLAVFLPVVRTTPIRVAVALPLTLFVPGYALIAALFPEAGESPADDQEADTTGASDDAEGADAGIDGIERVALSFGLSIAVVPLIGLVLNFTPWGIRLVPIMLSVSGVTLALTAVAAARRWALPPDERFAVPYRQWIQDSKAELLNPESQTDAVLNVVLVLSVLLAVSSVGYAVAVPKQGESFTEFYVLTENETGELVADGYPTEFERGESRELVVGIGNNEYESTDYTVVVEMQRVDIVDNETVIREATELRRFRTTVAHNETWHRQHTVTPRMTGERLRLQYLLYRGDPGASVNRSAAYRELHLWVNVTSQTG